MAVGAAVIFLIALLGIFGVRKLLRDSGGGPAPNGGVSASAEETTTVPETELKKAVTINEVDITGLSKSAARDAVTAKNVWGMKAVLPGGGEDSTYEIGNLLALKLEKVLTEIYDSGKPAADSYVLNAEGLDAEIAAEAAEMAAKWNVKPKNGAVSGFDKETNSFTYSESQDGRTVDQEAAAADIRTAMNEQDYGATVTVKAEITPAELTAAQAKERYKVIGTFTTKATANADRNNNLKLACQAIDGRILKVGEEFSFNQSTGNRTEARGYKPAGAYQNGKVVLEPGGGVCQVSSTLYNAVIRAGITPTERHAHTFEPSYVTPGEDATVSYDGYAGPDMRFVNTTSSSIAIRAAFYDRTVTVSVVGLPVLEEGVTISLQSSKTEEFDNGGVEYVEDPTLQPGVEKVISEGSIGSRWVTNLVTKKNGEVVSNNFFHNSTYKGHTKTIARNTSGVVASTTGAENMTIVENTETVPEMAGDSATEAETVATVMIGPGESVPQTTASETVSVKPAETHAAPTQPAPTQAPATQAAQPAPAEPVTQQTQAEPVQAPGPAEPAPASETVSAGPGGGGSEETVAPFPGG